MYRLIARIIGLLLVLAVGPAHAADAAIAVRGTVSPDALGPGQPGLLQVEIDVPEGWHLWSLDPGPGPHPLRIGWADGAGLQWGGSWYGDPPQQKMDRGFGRMLWSYEQRTVHLERQVELSGARASVLEVRAEICSAKQCLNQRVDLPIELELLGASSGAVPPEPTLAELSLGEPESETQQAAVAPPASPPGGGLAGELDAARERGVLAFMAMAFLFGLGALATPCVFPAIPLTVSFFSKFSGESFGRGARLAFVYATTMVAAFTFLGVMLSVVFGVTGVQQFAAHPLFNLILACLLVFFALNLLGLFELTPPEFLVSAVNRLETEYGASPGSAAGKGGGARDYVVVAIAAVSATTVFFTCTVAFVGLVLVAAANGEWFWPTVGMLAFASAFALPFFLLALFPQAARRLQGKAGSWLAATRVTLGFLELAAATKFFSNADLVWATGLLGRNVVLSVWVPLFFLCGMFLMGKLRIGEESTARDDGGTGVPQLLAAVVMFSLSIHLGLGLLHNRPFGSWIDGWLPPLQASLGPTGPAAGEASARFDWGHSLREARAEAQREGKLVFVNYTGYTCTNCRYMEGGVFPDPRIAPLLRQMVLVELYTDGGTPEHDANRQSQVDRFQTAALPLYAVEDASGNILGTFPSSTNDVSEFRQFLQSSMARGASQGAGGGVASAVGAAAPAAPSPEPPPAAEGPGGLSLRTTHLFDSDPRSAFEPGRWTLLNFWATWCSPCRTELEEFLVRVGAEFEKQGGRFRLVAVEDDGTLDTARGYVKKLGVPEPAALRVPGEPGPREIDERFGFEGTLPFTALVSPEGDVVWSHTNALSEEQLRDVLQRYALPQR